jgi:hypothetical protein
MADEITIDDAMTRRFELAEQLDLLAAELKARSAPLQEEMTLCENYIRGELLKSGAQNWKSATTGHATHFTTKSKCQVADFEATLAEIRAHNLWHLLTKAVSKEAVKEYIEEHKQPPPGVNYTEFKDLAWSRGKL